MPIEKWSENVAVLHLADDPQFTDDLEALEKAPATSRMHAVLDFASVHFINSSNLAKLLKMRKQIGNKEGRMILCNLATQVWSTFLITGLDKIFEFSENVTTALLQVGAEE